VSCLAPAVAEGDDGRNEPPDHILEPEVAVLKFIAKLFAAEVRPATDAKARLSLDAMEARYARGFNPQPDPPLNPALARTIIAINPGSANGLIVEGGHTRGIIIEGG